LKTLIILRHAKAEAYADDGTDIHRPLSERGHRDSLLVGKTLRKLELVPDLILASPSTRTRQTVDGVVEKLKRNVPITFEESIYDASVGTLFQLVARQQSPDTILLVGHNPGLEELVARCVRPESPPSFHLPTAGVVRLDFAISSWDQLSSTHGELAWFSSPDYLRPLD
jgi:phosphohistidine phosphatase SixA